MRKAVYKIQRRNYGEARFLLHPQPQEDELLSSWLVRVALEHEAAPATFTNLYLPEWRNSLWANDVDLQGDESLLERLETKSGVAKERLFATTLRGYDGYLFERAHGRTGGTLFVGPLGMRGRRSTLPGLRYCPKCLSEDERPYFRRKWRLTFSVACQRHSCYLLDRCQGCGTPLTPYLACRTGCIDICHKCGGRLVAAEALPVFEAGETLKVLERLYAVLDDGYVMIGGTPVHSHLYFQVLHQILKMTMSRRAGQRLREGIGLDQQVSPECRAFESVPLHEQAEMIVKAAWLLNDWPERFIDVCQRQNLLSSALLRDMKQAPFWYSRVVIEALYQPDKW